MPVLLVEPDAVSLCRTIGPNTREATAFFPRSYSWFDQRLREGQFVLPDGTAVRALRTPGGYRRFTLAMLRDIAVICTNQGWFSLDELKFTLRELSKPLEVGTARVAGHLPELEQAAVTWQAGQHQPDALAALVVAHDVLGHSVGKGLRVAGRCRAPDAHTADTGLPTPPNSLTVKP